MRLTNRNKASFYHFIGTATVFFSIISVLLYIVDRIEFQSLGWRALAFMIISLVSFIVFYLKGRQVFEYDSDGEVLNFKNKNVISYLDKRAIDEFPKYKLLEYQIVDAIIFKRLYIIISSKKHHSTTLKYDISYLSAKDIRDLKISLNKIIKLNKENNKIN